MNDLISRSALLYVTPEAVADEESNQNEIAYAEGWNDCLESFCSIVKYAPAVDAEVVRHGKWEAVENTGPEEWCAPPIRCGNCGKTMPDVGAAFCPFCGQMNAEVEG